MMTAILMAIAAVVPSQAKATTDLKKFVVVVRVPETYDTELAKKVGPKWDKTIEYWKAQGVYVESFAFPQPGYIISGRDKHAEPGMITWGGQKVVSIVVLQAENMTEATELAKRCPVLDYGGSVEVRERPQ
ncbi:hypothetical protein GCM10007415_39950 [Parapedobacter pyrenivorans]|uniref:YCII-related domain-containing protein n=1 Tax=Parapedobacter pyrenivorans TaxID=1305674 RepID=A0A917HZP4_9SPHI|nr:hypothetical protein [Parapedobacter pyrenivorans]GGH00067.1 hypothetical protein GCM10007415_39950 [Parapedobacter pyrenivorans]